MSGPVPVPLAPLAPALAEDLERELREQLRKQLLGLGFHAFEVCVRRLLTEMGYREVRTLGRTHLKGRNWHGGHDMTALSHTGVTRSRLILQLKQYSRPVSRRFVDELRGTCLRVGAEQGLLVTLSHFSRSARKAAAAGMHTPIRLVDGEELLDLMVRHGVGVRRDIPSQPAVDEPFFETLATLYPSGNRTLPPASDTTPARRYNPW